MENDIDDLLAAGETLVKNKGYTVEMALRFNDKFQTAAVGGPTVHEILFDDGITFLTLYLTPEQVKSAHSLFSSLVDIEQPDELMIPAENDDDDMPVGMADRVVSEVAIRKAAVKP